MVDGEEAFNCVKRRFEDDETTYSLIVFDLVLPKLNGIDTAKMINDYLFENTG